MKRFRAYFTQKQLYNTFFQIFLFIFVSHIIHNYYVINQKYNIFTNNMESIKKRTSIRKYANREVSDELLNRLLEEAERTPTMGNLQLYSVVITRNEECKKALAPAHFNQPMITNAPVILTICADYSRTTIWAENRKAHPGYNNILSFMNAATDALLFTQTFTNLAEEAGLGTCFLGTTVYMPKMIIATLKLPKLVMPVATLTIGWPAEHPSQNERLPLRSIIHNEHFKAYTPENIDDFYAEKESLEENKEFVRINKVETLAQIFTDIRYTKKDCETMSKGFLEALQQQGFL